MSSEETVEVVIPLVKSVTSLTFRNLCYSVRQGAESKPLLKGLSGSFKSGRLTAILGPSGAGKSTLLNILSGFKTQNVDGKLLINNEVVDRQKYRQLVAYTEQHVPLLPDITVREMLHYVADLKLTKNVSYIHKTKIVNDIVALLGLESCSSTQAKVLSGGERKRLSIGLELVSNPKIMFFDEPSSGLDSVASLQIVSYMKDLARQGRCVVSVIHQPSSELLEIFDDIYVLEGGRCLYQGPLDDLLPCLAEAGFSCPQYYNRADFVLKIISNVLINQEKLEKLAARAQLVEVCSENGVHDEPSEREIFSEGHGLQYPISWWRQFVILTRRTALGTWRNFTLLKLRFLGHILFGLTIGAIFYSVGDNGAKVLSNIACLIMILIFITFANAMSVVLSFPLEISVFMREQKSNYYATSAYYFSKIVADFPLMLSGVTVFHLMTYYLTGQPNETDRIVMFWVICVLFGWMAQVYGMLGGSFLPIDISAFIVPCSLIPMLLFAGFFIKRSELLDAFKPLLDISMFKHGFEGLALSIYGHNRTDLACSEMFCYYRKSHKVLQLLEMESSVYWMDVAGLGAWIVVLHVLLYFSLRQRLRWNQ